MQERVQKAQDLFLEGYNCAQAVACAFDDVLGMDRAQIAQLTCALGGGMGRLREVCGAVSAMVLVAGCRFGYNDPSDREGKSRVYALVQRMAAMYRQEHGSIICREILKKPAGADSSVPEERTPDYYASRPCVRMVGSAARILEEILQEEHGNP